MWALLPLKCLDAAKQRLSAVLAPEQRSQFMLAMAGDVLAALGEVPAISRVCVVSDDPYASVLAARWGAECWTERELGALAGLNGTIEGAVKRLANSGCEEMLVLPGDLPLLDAASVCSFIDAWRSLPDGHRLALAASHDGGTSLLLANPQQTTEFCYGPDSFARHSEMGNSQGAAVVQSDLPRAALDIDCPGDLVHLIAEMPRLCGVRTAHVLKTIIPTLPRSLFAEFSQLTSTKND